MAELSALWLSVELAATASSVMAGMVSLVIRDAVGAFMACARCEMSGVVICVMCVGDCQNSAFAS